MTVRAIEDVATNGDDHGRGRDVVVEILSPLHERQRVPLKVENHKFTLNDIQALRSNLVCKVVDPASDPWTKRDTRRALGSGPPSLERTLGFEIPSS